MSKETLHTLRLVIPALLLLLVTFLLFQPDVDAQDFLSSSIANDSIIYLASIALFGVAYYAFDFRKYAIKKPLEKVQNNIKQGLLQAFQDDKKIIDISADLQKDRKLLNIFYSFVDNDNSLKERAKEVYFNGLIWSTIADIRIISGFAFFLYLIAFFYSQNNQYLFFALICILTFLSSFLFMSLITKRQIELSNLQIEFIIMKYKKELNKDLLKAV